MTNLAPWLDRAANRIATVPLGPAIEEFGRVQTVADGIAMISGLPSARLDEVLRFDRGQLGFVQTLDRDLIGCVLLNDAEAIEAGDLVRGTGEVIRTAAGPGLLGRVVDPLARPLDDGLPVEAVAHDPIESPAPAIVDRQTGATPRLVIHSAAVTDGALDMAQKLDLHRLAADAVLAHTAGMPMAGQAPVLAVMEQQGRAIAVAALDQGDAVPNPAWGPRRHNGSCTRHCPFFGVSPRV